MVALWELLLLWAWLRTDLNTVTLVDGDTGVGGTYSHPELANYHHRARQKNPAGQLL